LADEQKSHDGGSRQWLDGNRRQFLTHISLSIYSLSNQFAAPQPVRRTSARSIIEHKTLDVEWKSSQHPEWLHKL